MFELMGVEAITVVPGGSDMGAAMPKIAQDVASLGRKGYIIPGGGSNAIGGLGYVACVQEMQQQWFDEGVALDRRRGRLGQLGHPWRHGWPASSATTSGSR